MRCTSYLALVDGSVWGQDLEKVSFSRRSMERRAVVVALPRCGVKTVRSVWSASEIPGGSFGACPVLEGEHIRGVGPRDPQTRARGNGILVDD